MQSRVLQSLHHVKIFLRTNKNITKSILLGQILSLFICGTAISSAYLSQIKVNIPLSQSFLNYLLLALTYGILFIYTKSSTLWMIIKSRSWIYLIAAFIDVEANYAIVKAYQYTSVTSVQLLDCMTIPTVVALSLLVFQLRYRWSHYVAIVLCLSGAITMVIVDYYLSDSSSNVVVSKNPFLGDSLVIIGAVLYGLSNVFQDFMVKKHGQIEYLAFIGFFCSIINGVQIIILEKSDLYTAFSLNYRNSLFWFSFVGFVMSMFLLYSLMPYVMKISSSVVTNLSLLTADVYALLVGLFIFAYKFHWLYFLAYLLIMVGVGGFVAKEPLRVGEDLSLNCCKGSNLICCKRLSTKEDDNPELPANNALMEEAAA